MHTSALVRSLNSKFGRVACVVSPQPTPSPIHGLTQSGSVPVYHSCKLSSANMSHRPQVLVNADVSKDFVGTLREAQCALLHLWGDLKAVLVNSNHGEGWQVTQGVYSPLGMKST